MIAGIDEAGKGPVIGPMVVCGVMAEEEIFEELKRLGVRDSKKLSKSRREELFEQIERYCALETVVLETVVLEAKELNELMKVKNINEILFDCYSAIIKKLKPEIAYVDSCDVDSERLSVKLEKATGVKVVAMHKADVRRVEVASASIVAKVLRDKRIEEIKKELGDFGSGYPSDPKTIEFLRSYYKLRGEFPPHSRTAWKTLKKVKDSVSQTKLF